MLKVTGASNNSPDNAQKAFRQFMARTDIGFKDLPTRVPLIQSSYDLAHRFQGYKTLALIGIGGSSVGPETLWSILGPLSGKNLVVFDNVDHLDFRRKILKLNLQETAWFIVSKSGGTIETLLNTELVSEIYRSEGLNFYAQAAVCTENRVNPLYDWAEKHKVPRLEIPLDVGGRFSVLSPVGLFPLAFGGVDVEALLAGAEKAREASASLIPVARDIMASWPQHNITCFFFYSSVMKPFGAWIQQLWAESLGKKLDRRGQKVPSSSTPLFVVGSNDQHSILQQLEEGNRDKFVLFFRSEELESASHPIPSVEFSAFPYLKGKKFGSVIAACAAGTEQALQSAGVPTMNIAYPDHSAYTMGFLVMWFELLVATLGEMMDIDAFNQPGVEGSKRITREILGK